MNQNIWRIAPFNIASAILVVVAGLTTGFTTYLLWLAALVIQAGSPLVVRLGGRFDINSAHFAERHGALIIAAIGESIAAIGIGAAHLPVTPSLALTAIALSIGAAAFSGGTAAFRAAMKTGPITPRVVAAIFALATTPLGAFVSIEAQLFLLTVGLVALLAAERLSRRSGLAAP